MNSSNTISNQMTVQRDKVNDLDSNSNDAQLTPSSPPFPPPTPDRMKNHKKTKQQPIYVSSAPIGYQLSKIQQELSTTIMHMKRKMMQTIYNGAKSKRKKKHESRTPIPTRQKTTVDTMTTIVLLMIILNKSFYLVEKNNVWTVQSKTRPHTNVNEFVVICQHKKVLKMYACNQENLKKRIEQKNQKNMHKILHNVNAVWCKDHDEYYIECNKKKWTVRHADITSDYQFTTKKPEKMQQQKKQRKNDENEQKKSEKVALNDKKDNDNRFQNIMSLNTTSLSHSKLESMLSWAQNNNVGILNLQEIMPAKYKSNVGKMTKHIQMIKKHHVVEQLYHLKAARGWNDRGLMTLIKKNDNDNFEVISTGDAHIATKINWDNKVIINMNIYINPNFKKESCIEVMKCIEDLLKSLDGNNTTIVMQGDMNMKRMDVIKLMGDITPPVGYSINYYNEENNKTFYKKINNNNEQEQIEKIVDDDEEADGKENAIDHTITITPDNMCTSHFVPRQRHYIEGMKTQHVPIFLTIGRDEDIEQQKYSKISNITTSKKLKSRVKHLPLTMIDSNGEIKDLFKRNKKLIEQVAKTSTRRKILRMGNAVANDQLWSSLVAEYNRLTPLNELVMRSKEEQQKTVNKMSNKFYDILYVTTQNQLDNKTPTPTSRHLSSVSKTEEKWWSQEKKLEWLEKKITAIKEGHHRLRRVSKYNTIIIMRCLVHFYKENTAKNEEEKKKKKHAQAMVNMQKLLETGSPHEAEAAARNVAEGRVRKVTRNAKMSLFSTKKKRIVKSAANVAAVYSDYLQEQEELNDKKPLTMSKDEASQQLALMRGKEGELEREVEGLRVQVFREDWYLKDFEIEDRHLKYTTPNDSWRDLWLVKFKADFFTKSPLWNSKRMEMRISLEEALKHATKQQKNDYKAREETEDRLAKMRKALYAKETELCEMKKANEEFEIRNNYIPAHQYNCNDTAPINNNITIEEVASAVISMKNFKAMGSDMVNMEMLKACVMKPHRKPKFIVNDDDNNYHHSIKDDTLITTLGQYNRRNGELYDEKNMRMKTPKNPFITTATQHAAKHPSPMLIALHMLLDYVFTSGMLPSIWKMNMIVMLYKKGEKSEAKNYRPVNISSVVQKILNKILATRLQDVNRRICDDIAQKIAVIESEEGNKDAMYQLRRKSLGVKPLWSNNQVAYLRNRDRFEHISTLIEYNQTHINNKKNPYNIFIDLTRAFDSVSHEKLLHVLNVKLNNKSGNSKFTEYIKSMYDNIYYTTRVKNKYSPLKKQRWGIKQGCCVSPILFNLYFDLVITEIEEKYGEEVMILAYADDLIIAMDDEVMIARVMRTLCDIMQRLNLEMNMTKSEIMQMKKSCVSEDNIQRKPYRWACIDGTNGSLSYVNEYKYLGLTIDYMNKVKINKSAFYAPLFKYSNLFFSRGSPQQFKIRMFNVYVMPKIMSNAAVLGILVNGKGGMKKAVYEDVINTIEKVVMQMMMRKSEEIPLQTCTRTIEYDVLGIQNPWIQLQQQATRLVMDLVEKDKMNVNTWLYHHIHDKRRDYDVVPLKLPPILATIRGIYNDMKNMLVVEQDGYEKDVKAKCWKIDMTGALTTKMQHVIKNHRYHEAPVDDKYDYEMVELRNDAELKCNNIHEAARATGIADPFPIRASNKPHSNHKIGAVQRMLKNKIMCDEMAIEGRVTMKKYLCGRRYECNKNMKMIRTSTTTFEKELLSIQEMRMGKRTGATWSKDDKKFIYEDCEKCAQHTKKDLVHQLVQCPHMNSVIEYALVMFNNRMRQEKMKMNEKCEMYEKVRQDVKRRHGQILNTGENADPVMQRIIEATVYNTREEYDRDINNMSKFVNIGYINMLRSHRKDEWPQEAHKMKSRIPPQLHWVLEDNFYEIYKMNVHLIENKKMVEVYDRRPKKMLQKMRSLVTNESTLWSYLVSPGGSVTQQSMATTILACILQSKSRCEAMASFNITIT
ncbi:reverse transcriptase family protein [Chryseobacterium sp.]|uniref:RNA-directed DNA polymerase n=1 Tax=Chryseobacterium sp. TaxID=1871047 RepID=UPI00321AB9D4